jgi:hypothetical protein
MDDATAYVFALPQLSVVAFVVAVAVWFARPVERRNGLLIAVLAASSCVLILEAITIAFRVANP